MKFKYPALVFAAMLPALGFASELTIEGSGNQREVACEGRDVQIKGFNHVISLTGECGNIVVQGRGNQVSFEKGDSLAVRAFQAVVQGGSVGQLEVANSGNQVSVTLDGAAQESSVRVKGFEHKLTLALASKTEFKVEGKGNSVIWKTQKGVADPSANISGFNNTVQRAD